MNEFALKRVDDPNEWEAIFRFRADIWRASEGVATNAFPSGAWKDRHDENAFHWVITNGLNQIVASARLSLHPTLSEVVEPFQYERYGIQPNGLIAAPDRVAVCPSARRQGLAEQLLDAQDQLAIERGAVIALRQASPSMCKLIVKRGWELVGPASVDPRFPGIEFTVATKHFKTPTVCPTNSNPDRVFASGANP